MTAEDYVAEIIAVTRDAGLEPDDIAKALLVGAFTVARGAVDPLDWAQSLEKGAAVIRAEPLSQEKH